MKNLLRIAQAIYREPWIVTESMLYTIQTTFEAHRAGQTVSLLEQDDEDESESEARTVNRTAIIPVHGVLGKHLSSLETMCGGCSVDAISKQIDEAEANYGIQKILFDFRTPGGNACGIPEIGQKIAAIEKATAAYTDYDCCSGGYWLASQCDIIGCTPSSEVGSVGVYSIYTDRSKQLEDAGVKVNPIVAGEYKIAGASFKPMTDAERQLLQDQVNYLHAEFQNAILSKREIDPSLLEGQIFYGKQAVENGFADLLVESIEEMID